MRACTSALSGLIISVLGFNFENAVQLDRSRGPNWKTDLAHIYFRVTGTLGLNPIVCRNPQSLKDRGCVNCESVSKEFAFRYINNL